MIERELKFAVPDLDTVRQRLEALGAERHPESPGDEDNWVFDRNGELAASGRLLRLRSDQTGARLTYKGAPEWQGTTKLREEREVTVADAATLRGLLEALGYEVVRRYQKVREEWSLAATVIALDHTPMGDFVEFEGADAESVATRSGFRLNDALEGNYLQLYEDYRGEHPEAPPDMVFS